MAHLTLSALFIVLGMFLDGFGSSTALRAIYLLLDTAATVFALWRASDVTFEFEGIVTAVNQLPPRYERFA